MKGSLLVSVLAVVACGNTDGDKEREPARSGAMPAPAPGSAGSAAAPPAAAATRPARAAPADAAYVVLKERGLVAIEDGAFRTLVDDKYVGARAMARQGGGIWVYVERQIARGGGELAPVPGAPAKHGVVAVGPDGTLWASGEGLASYDGKAWRTHALPASVKRPFVRKLAFAPDGARYGLVGTAVVVGRGDTWSVATAEGQIASDLAIAGDGTIYVAIRDQLARIADGELASIAAVKGEALTLATAPDGTVHAFGPKGVRRIAGGKLEPVAKMPVITDPTFGPDGTLYGVSTDGLRIVRRRSDGAVDKIPAGKDLPFKARSVVVDARDRLWLVLAYGMAVVDGDQLTVLTPGTVPELSHNVEAIVVTGKGPDLPDVGPPKLIHLKGVIVAKGKPQPGVKLEICPEVGGVFHGSSPCEGQSFVRRATTGATGSFTISDVPLGGWHLVYKKSAGAWVFYFPPGCCAGLAKGVTFDMGNIEFGTSSR